MPLRRRDSGRSAKRRDNEDWLDRNGEHAGRKASPRNLLMTKGGSLNIELGWPADPPVPRANLCRVDAVRLLERAEARMTEEIDHLATIASIPQRLAGIVALQAMLGGVGLRTLRSDDRHGHLVRIRQRIAYEARQSGFSLWQIGRALNRDHNTVMYSIKAEAGRLAG